LLLIAGITTVSLAALAVIYRPLVLECVDPGLPALGQPRPAAGAYRIPRPRRDEPVGGFHALGTLLAVVS